MTQGSLYAGRRRWRVALIAVLAVACSKSSKQASESAPPSSSASPPSATPAKPAVDGPPLTVPDGFGYRVYVKDLGRVRHIAVRATGDLYANLREPGPDGKSLVAVRDADGDGTPERVEYFSDHGGGTGILIHDGHLYFTSTDEVFRKRFLSDNELVPSGPTETVVTGLPKQDSHAAKSIVVDDRGRLYVNVGAPSNACQEKSRSPGSPGIKPCPMLEKQGSIWRFSAGRVGQTLDKDGVKHATGLRNVVALAWNPYAGDLFGVQHGRDQLDVLWSEHFTARQSAELPAEEFLRISDGFVGGWPYTYYDPAKNQRMVAPEYGGDGKTAAQAGEYPEPVHAFPAHYAPNGLLFYGGTQFPAKYRKGAFIAFRGSWNRGDFGQEGYRVEFLPMNGPTKTGGPEVFADGFAGEGPIKTTRDADFRPTGLAEGVDGSLFVADTEKGWVWRITYGTDET